MSVVIWSNIDMSVSGSYTNAGRGVGDVVDVVRPDGSVLAGTIVEDYADVVVPVEMLGRNWAPVSRWAVALETGVLVFVDDADIVEDTGDTAGDQR
ncbi:hypothetical protein ACFULT_22180 [Rhodococcus sp. NPDC057297]|uniref:hypothetical protein n=1 Tax=Rhodococcus sp. NPDC057297 TaxID=3346090 RepID=UPI0036257633